jgi:hypothetical protein
MLPPKEKMELIKTQFMSFGHDSASQDRPLDMIVQVKTEDLAGALVGL